MHVKKEKRAINVRKAVGKKYTNCFFDVKIEKPVCCLLEVRHEKEQ